MSDQPETEGYKYLAYISYSHQDSELAQWLHNSLERYRVPTRFVGQLGEYGSVPKRLYPIFRDRDELPGGSDLSENIIDALKNSRHLIVICSRNVTHSMWVDKEIRTFKAMGGENRILCLIVDGEPNASYIAGHEDEECFPEAVRHHVDADGGITQERTEPIAPDLRSERDGKEKAKIKLIAGLLGIGFEELWQRDVRRNRNRLIFQVLITCFVVTTLAASLTFWKQSQLETFDRHVAQAEKLLTDGSYPEFVVKTAYIKIAYPGKIPPHLDMTLDYWMARYMPLSEVLTKHCEPGLYYWNDQQFFFDGQLVRPLIHHDPAKYGNFLFDQEGMILLVQVGLDRIDRYSVNPFRVLSQQQLECKSYCTIRVSRIEKSKLDGRYLFLAEHDARSIGSAYPVLCHAEPGSTGIKCIDSADNKRALKDPWKRIKEIIPDLTESTIVGDEAFWNSQTYEKNYVIVGSGIMKLPFPHIIKEEEMWEKIPRSSIPISVINHLKQIRIKDIGKLRESGVNGTLVEQLAEELKSSFQNIYLAELAEGYTLVVVRLGPQYVLTDISRYDKKGMSIGEPDLPEGFGGYSSYSVEIEGKEAGFMLLDYYGKERYLVDLVTLKSLEIPLILSGSFSVSPSKSKAVFEGKEQHLTFFRLDFAKNTAQLIVQTRIPEELCQEPQSNVNSDSECRGDIIIKTLNDSYTSVSGEKGIAVYDTGNGKLKCFAPFPGEIKGNAVFDIKRRVFAMQSGFLVKLYEMDKCLPLSSSFDLSSRLPKSLVTLYQDRKEMDIFTFLEDGSLVIGYKDILMRRKPPIKSSISTLKAEIGNLTGRELNGDILPLESLGITAK